MRAKWLCTLCLLLTAPFLSLQAAFIAPGDASLRHDLQLLADYGVIHAPVTTWPLPQGALLALRSADVDAMPLSVQRAHARVFQLINRPQAKGLHSDVTLRFAEPQQLRTFADTPRERAELTLGAQAQDASGGFRVAVTGALDPEDDRHVRFDGSYGALRLGNWIATVGAQDRWWGPGWEGSLILGTNHRPVPAISLERDQPVASDLPILRWLGPWQLTTFFGQLESDRSVSRPRLFGMRFSFRPWQALEIGVSRTAQWGGQGRPESVSSFGRMLLGQSNTGDTDQDIDGGDANQLAGFDLRWVSPIGDLPYAVYAELIGEDEAGGFPYRYIGLAGLELWGSLNGSDYRLHLEVADTTAEFHKSNPNFNVAYEHSGYIDGYRYRGRSMGHAMDGDGRMVSVGLQFITRTDGDWRLLLRHTEQNRDDIELRPGLSAEPITRTGADISYRFNWQGNQIGFGAGGDRVRDRIANETELEGRGWVSVSRLF